MIALAHAAAACFMAGLVWTMQLVHYPALEKSSSEVFARNVRRTIPLVVPAMAVEAATALLLLRSSNRLAWIGAGLLLFAWVISIFAVYPIHRRLSRTYSDDDFAGLLRMNRLRVAAWSARALVALALLRRAP